MTQYVYYVVYSLTDAAGNTGLGTVELTRDQPFHSIAEVYDTAREIKVRNRFSAVTITNWIQLSGPTSTDQALAHEARTARLRGA